MLIPNLQDIISQAQMAAYLQANPTAMQPQVVAPFLPVAGPAVNQAGSTANQLLGGTPPSGASQDAMEALRWLWQNAPSAPSPTEPMGKTREVSSQLSGLNIPGVPSSDESANLVRGSLSSQDRGTPSQLLKSQIPGVTGPRTGAAGEAEQELLRNLTGQNVQSSPVIAKLIEAMRPQYERTAEDITRRIAEQAGRIGLRDTGVSTTTARELGRLGEGFNRDIAERTAGQLEAERGRQFGSVDPALGLQTSDLNRALGLAGGLANTSGQLFGENLQGAGALNQFGQQGFQNQLSRFGAEQGNLMNQLPLIELLRQMPRDQFADLMGLSQFGSQLAGQVGDMGQYESERMRNNATAGGQILNILRGQFTPSAFQEAASQGGIGGGIGFSGIPGFGNVPQPTPGSGSEPSGFGLELQPPGGGYAEQFYRDYAPGIPRPNGYGYGNDPNTSVLESGDPGYSLDPAIDPMGQTFGDYGQVPGIIAAGWKGPPLGQGGAGAPPPIPGVGPVADMGETPTGGSPYETTDTGLWGPGGSGGPPAPTPSPSPEPIINVQGGPPGQTGGDGSQYIRGGGGGFGGPDRNYDEMMRRYLENQRTGGGTNPLIKGSSQPPADPYLGNPQDPLAWQRGGTTTPSAPSAPTTPTAPTMPSSPSTGSTEMNWLVPGQTSAGGQGPGFPQNVGNQQFHELGRTPMERAWNTGITNQGTGTRVDPADGRYEQWRTGGVPGMTAGTSSTSGAMTPPPGLGGGGMGSMGQSAGMKQSGLSGYWKRRQGSGVGSFGPMRPKPQPLPSISGSSSGMFGRGTAVA